MKEQLRAAEKAMAAYHYIADSPMELLLNDQQTQERLSGLVSASRDAYRRAQSFGGRYRVPLRKWVHESEYDLSPVGLDLCFGAGLVFELRSDRGRTILTGPEWGAAPEDFTWLEPFSDIAIGDRIADIPDLIARIKR